MKCRRCIENANSYSLICKTARWHLPDSRAVDKNRALTLLWISAARVCPVLLILSSLFHFSPPPPAQPTSLLKSSPSLRRSSWSAALQAGGVVMCETCLINDDPDLCYRGGPWSSTEAKSPPLIVPHLRANKRPRSLVSLEMDYYPFCILLHPSRVFFPLSLPLQHISCFIFFSPDLNRWADNPPRLFSNENLDCRAFQRCLYRVEIGWFLLGLVNNMGRVTDTSKGEVNSATPWCRAPVARSALSAEDLSVQTCQNGTVVYNMYL